MGLEGGIYVFYDDGLTCDHYYNLTISQVDAIGVDMDGRYNTYFGLQDYEHWKGPGNRADRKGISSWI